jgi:iron complex outermembrane receptor protein
MTFAVVPRSAPAVKPLALACAISLSAIATGAFAQQTIPSVVISGTRFAAQAAHAPIGASVITADDIRRAGATDVNQAIRKIGGVYGRQSLDGSPDFALDLRGFGANSSQNLVVMVDGVRLNENELAGAVLSTIPIDTVERIEITRGGSSVLYGEGATGGVIQIVTRGAAAKAGTHGTLFAEAGRFGHRDARASLTHRAGALSLDAAVASLDTDNYRANSGFEQDTFSGGLQWTYGAGKAGVRVESARQDSRFPGSLSLQQFQADPRQAATPDDFGSLDTDRVSAFVEHRIGNVDLAAELSHREREVKANYMFGSFVSRMAYDSEQTQFSPRLRRQARLGDKTRELVAGIDLIRWKRKTTSDFSLGDAEQDSKAIYLRDEIRWDAPHNARVALGVRHEKFDKDYVDPLASKTGESGSQSLNAWTLEASYDVVPGVTVHAKAGRSYRVANVDENSLRSSEGLLEPQTSRDLEFGAAYKDATRQLSARVFRHRLENEIFYDPTIFWGANTNLDPTRRQGIEIEGQLALAAAWRVIGNWQHVDAEFTGGPNAGREMVLVPKNVVTARLAWVPGDGQSADIGAQWVDSQRNGGDFTNSCDARIPSYTTIDARYARRFGPFEFAASALNLADRDYYSNAFGCRSGIYPSSGRQLKFSVRYDF